jgi:large subunit ribosomal protein L25
MSLVNLTIHPRTSKGKNANRRTRAAGRVPAVVYGKDRSSDMVEIDAHGFGVILTKLAGRSAIFQLAQEGVTEETIALLREVQRHPVSDEILHVDLLEIPRGVPVTVGVSLEITGASPAVKSGEGSVAQSLTSVEISCLPRELPEYIEVDISELQLNDKVFVKDLKTPVGEIVSDPEALVLNIKPASLLAAEDEDEGAEGEEGAEGAEGGDAAEEKSED